MEDLGAREIPVEEVGKGGGGGKWDYEGLAQALKNIFPNPSKGEVKAAEVLVEKVLKYHSTGDIKNRAHYARRAIEKAVKINGWELVKARTVGGKYIRFAVKF